MAIQIIYLVTIKLNILCCNYFLQMDMSQADWLRNSGWSTQKENILLIHGYAGGDDTLPIVVLKDG